MAAGRAQGHGGLAARDLLHADLVLSFRLDDATASQKRKNKDEYQHMQSCAGGTYVFHDASCRRLPKPPLNATPEGGVGRLPVTADP